MLRTVIMHVQNEPFVLSRVIGLLTRRGFPVQSINTGASPIPGVSRLTLVVECDGIDQVLKQLNRLVPALHVAEAEAVEPAYFPIPITQS